MNRLFNRNSRQLVNQVFSVSLVVALLLGYLPQPVVQAAAPAAPNALCQIPASGGSKTFLPLIRNLGLLVAATVFPNVTQPQAVPRQIRYEVGKTYVYEWNLTVDSKSMAHDSEGTHDNGATTTVIHALADVTVIAKDDSDVYRGEVALRDPFICNTDGTHAAVAQDAELVQALQTPLSFQQRSNGVVVSVSLPSDAPPQATNLQKGVVNALQLTLQETGNGYEVEEKGAQGIYKATYTLEEKDNNLHVTKGFDQTDFSTLVQAGDATDTLTMQISTTVILNGDQGVLTSMESSEVIASGSDEEPANTPEGTYAGATIWSKVVSTSKFTLKEVKDASQLQVAAVPLATYVDGDLSATLVEQNKNRQGIDLSQVDLDTEFATLEGEPENPDHFSRILDLVSAVPGTAVLDKLQARLQANTANDELAKRYVDILAAVGTPYAQGILNSVLDNPAVNPAALSASLSADVQEQALIDLVLLSSPTITTVNTVQGLSAPESESPLQETAVAVLGATIKNLADEDAGMAQTLTDGLVQSLSAITVPTDVQIYLDALGNTGLPSVFPTIQSYISGTVQSAGIDSSILADPDVRTAALVALRNIPGQEAEQLLVATLNNSEEEEAVRMQAASALADRPDLSQAASTALQSYQSTSLATPGLYRRYWYGKLGGSKLGVEFPGGMTVASPPSYYLYIYAYQQANGLIWGRRFNVAQGSVLARGQSNSILFGAYLSLAGNRIRKQWEQTVPCSASRSGTVWQGYLTFLDQTVSIPVAGVITVDLTARVRGWAGLDYSLTANICTFNNSSASVSITPRVWATAAGEASLSLAVVRGGAGISATILNTRLPLNVSAAYNGSTFRFCGNIRVETTPLSGRIYGFADVRVIFWWKRVFEGTIWSWSSPSYSYTLWSSCS